MRKFNEERLLRELDRLPSYWRCAFANAAAGRQIINVKRGQNFVSSSSAWTEVLDVHGTIWRHQEADQILDRDVWESRLTHVLALIPSNDDPPFLGDTYLESALTSLAYSIRCLLSQSSQEAVWAARHSYEVCDEAVSRLVEYGSTKAETETALLRHPIIQLELERQDRDLVLIRKGDLAQLERLSAEEDVFDEDTWKSTVNIHND